MPRSAQAGLTASRATVASQGETFDTLKQLSLTTERADFATFSQYFQALLATDAEIDFAKNNTGNCVVFSLRKS